MQTTLRIDDATYREAKAEAARLGLTLTRFIEEALRERVAAGGKGVAARRSEIEERNRLMESLLRRTARFRARPLTHEVAVAWVQLWKRHDVRPITVPHVDLALELTARHRISYYDALILAAAQFAGCAVVCSEDLNAGQEYGTVRVENPFLTGAR